MIDKLFVRDILEQLLRLDPRLRSNIEIIKTGSFEDATRVHLLTEEEWIEELEVSELVLLKRERNALERTIKSLEERKSALTGQMADDTRSHEQGIVRLREQARRIKQSALKRSLPLP